MRDIMLTLRFLMVVVVLLIVTVAGRSAQSVTSSNTMPMINIPKTADISW